MADQDSLAQSLSEEESELIIGGGALPSSGTVKLKKGKGSMSPTRQKDQTGYKFKADQQTLTSSNFDFASQSKNNNGQTNNHSNSNSSSEDADDQEEFVVLNPGELNGDGGSTPGTPTTPSKLPTPHKRTAELVETGSEKGSSGGANGSPPSSPAPKKHKAWDEYVAEDDAKRGKGKKTQDEEEEEEDEGLVRKIGRCFGVALLFMLPIVIGVYFGPRMNFGEQPEIGVTLMQKPVYSWGNASKAVFRNLKKMEASFPNQNRETWIQLVASITSTLDETEPEHPSAITVLLPPNLPPNFSTCLLTKIATILNTAVAPILKDSSKASPPKVITPGSFATSSITKIRENLDTYFKSEGKAVLALDVDKLQKEPELLLFHGLCDNFLAVDKRATVLFPVRVPLQIYQKYEWTHARGGDISTDVLNEAFGKVVSADTGPALVARIADAVILLNEGDKC